MASREEKIRSVEAPQLKKGIPDFKVGDTVSVHVKIVEEDKTRIQIFEGIVIAKRGSGLRTSITVRKVSFGEGVERVFPVNSPAIEKIEVKKHGEVKKAKLYYLRGKIGKATKVEEKMDLVGPQTETQTQTPNAQIREKGKAQGL
jgi:large subunit ribosomal protein L19